MHSANTLSPGTVADATDATGAQDTKTKKAPAFVTASTIKPEKPQWLWLGYLPLRALVILDGDPGLGKSTLVADLAARVTTGRPMPCGASGDGPAGVIICNAEDDPASVMVPRLLAAGADLDRVAFPSLDEAMLLNEAWLADLETAITSREARLVVIDPLFAFMPAGTDTHRDADVRRVLGRVAAMARRTGTTVLLVRHPNKAEGMKALHRGGGSIGIIGAARTGLLLARDPADTSGCRRVLVGTKTNVGVMPRARSLDVLSDPTGEQPVIKWLGTLDIEADDLVQVKAGRPATRREEAEEFLKSLLASGPVPATEVMELAVEEDIKEKTLRRAADKLGVVHSRDGFGGDGHHAWSLPSPDEEAKHEERGAPPAPATAAEVMRLASRLGYPSVTLDDIEVPSGASGWSRFASPTNLDAPLNEALDALNALESEGDR